MTTSVSSVLESLDRRPTPAAYHQAARDLASVSGNLTPVRIALLASFTIEPLVPFLRVEAARCGFAADMYVAPFDAVSQELLDPSSGCARHRPNVVFVARLLEDVSPALHDQFLSLDARQVAGEAERVIAETITALSTFRQHSNAAVVVHNFPCPPGALGIYEAMASESQTHAVWSLNERLAAATRSMAGSFVLDFDRVCADVGYRHWRDTRTWFLGRAPLSVAALPALAAVQATFIQALHGVPRKCLVLDLDNTLWGGVVGEDGVAGIQLGHTYPGNVFRAFQRALTQLHDRGVLLAINSKNNPADVDEVFRRHPDMVLRPEHVAAMRTNWRDKPDNMLEIAQELNLGVDSLVFFDDNPAERALMRRALPDVLTIEVPDDPMAYVGCLRASGAFERLSFTEEDRGRTRMYHAIRERARIEQSAVSVEQFLGTLQMQVSISATDAFSFPRVLELIHKTNQFNLTTRRWSAAELSAVMGDAETGVFSLRLSDRFGDQGIVGVAIARVNGTVGEIDTLLLSCRVIGRQVETAFLRFLADWAAAHGALHLEGEFIETAKNAPARDVYARHGFREVGQARGRSRWRLDLHGAELQWPRHIAAA